MAPRVPFLLEAMLPPSLHIRRLCHSKRLTESCIANRTELRLICCYHPCEPILLLSLHGDSLPLHRRFAPVAWGIMHHMGIVEIGVVLIFIVAVALAVWWVVVRLRG